MLIDPNGQSQDHFINLKTQLNLNLTSDDSHDMWMWDCTLDLETLLVEELKLLVVLLCSVHLDLQGIYFQQLSALLVVIFTFLSLQQIVL